VGAPREWTPEMTSLSWNVLGAEGVAEQIAWSLEERAVDVYQVNGVEILSRWYHSNCDADLMLWLSLDSRVIRFQLSVHGQVLDWSARDGVRTGVILETEVSPEPGSVVEEIRFDEKIEPKVLWMGRRVLQAAPQLKSEWREMIEICLRQGPRATGNAPRLAARPNFWSRLKRWLFA